MINRKEQSKKRLYACVGTGNFNEDTAALYTDHLLMTTDRRITGEVARVFEFFATSPIGRSNNLTAQKKSQDKLRPG